MRADALQLNRAQRMQWMIRVLCLLGIFVAGYLAWSYLGGTEPYCGGTESCAEVQNSSYADVAGIPVPVIGLVGYALLLGLSLLRGRLSAELDFYLPVLSFGAALIGVLYSAYLTYIEAYVLLAWCYWCVASAVIITAIWVLTIVDLRRAWVE